MNETIPVFMECFRMTLNNFDTNLYTCIFNFPNRSLQINEKFLTINRLQKIKWSKVRIGWHFIEKQKLYQAEKDEECIQYK